MLSEKGISAAETASRRRYAVFLSYRHLDNKEPGREWATWLHQALESYEIPSDLVGAENAKGERVPASLYPVFRDEEELPADANLTQTIRQALENSSLLVVLCSPRAVESRFVGEEIRYFKQVGRADRILALIIDGEPNAVEDPGKRGAGILIDAECLPEPLRYGVTQADGTIDWSQRTEPIAADARPDGRPEQGWTTGAAYREALRVTGKLSETQIAKKSDAYEHQLKVAKLKVVAGAIGVPLGVLTQRDKAMQLAKARQGARVLRRWLMLVVVLAILAMVAGIAAWGKRQEAQAESERRRQLLAEAAQSDRLRAEEYFERGDRPAGLAYLARAIRYDPAGTVAAEKVFAELNNWRFPPVLQVFSHDDAAVSSAGFSPDGTLVVTASGDKTAKIWLLSTGRIAAVLQGHQAPLTNALFTADGQRVVTIARHPEEASPDGDYRRGKIESVRLWETNSGKLLSTFTPSESAVEIQVDRVGHCVLLRSEDNVVQISDIRTGTLLAILKGVGPEGATLSPDGERVIVRYSDNGIILWDIHGRLLRKVQDAEYARFDADGRWSVCFYQDRAELWDPQSGQTIASVSIDPKYHLMFGAAKFSPDAKLAVTTWPDGIARVVSLDGGSAVADLPVADRSDTDELKSNYTVEFSPDGQKVLTVRSDGRTCVWDVRSGHLLAEAKGLQAQWANFSPDGKIILAFPMRPDVVPDLWKWGLSAALYSAETGKLLTESQQPGSDLQFSPDCSSVLSIRDGIARLWQTHRKGILPEFDIDQFDTVEFNTDDSKVVTSSTRGTARIWDSATGNLLRTFPQSGQAKFISQDRQIVTFGSDNLARVWDTTTGDLRFSFEVSGEIGESPYLSGNGQRVVTLKSRTAQVRDLSHGDLITTFELPDSTSRESWFRLHHVRISADGKQVLDAFDESVDLWDADTGTRRCTLRHPSRVADAQFSPDGTRVLTGSYDLTPRVWDASTGKLLAALQPATPPSQPLSRFSFSPDGHYIFSGYAPTVLWDTRTYRVTGQLTDTVEAFSRDGERLITGASGLGPNKGSILEIWDARSCEVTARLRAKEGDRFAALSSNGKYVVTSHLLEKTVRFWSILPTDAGEPPSWFVHLLPYLAQQRLNSAGGLEPLPVSEWLDLRDRLQRVRKETAHMNTPYCELVRRIVPE